MRKYINSEKDCERLWREILPGKTIYKVDNDLYIGHWTLTDTVHTISLRPLNNEEEKYLQDRGYLKGLKIF